MLEAPVTVYNFEVEDFHTYYVGDGVLVHNACKVEGSGHGHDIHKQKIDDMISKLEESGDYVEIYGNRSLKTAGLNGTQRPDIIAKTKEGLYEIWEFASPSQANGTYGYKLLEAKVKIMQSNNPPVIIHEIIPW